MTTLATIADTGSQISTLAFVAFIALIVGAIVGGYATLIYLNADTARRLFDTEHVCTGCFDNPVDVCGHLCPNCTFDAKTAAARIKPTVEAEWQRYFRKDQP